MSMRRMNCPNCGAPINGKICEYCGTVHAKEAEQVRIEVEHGHTDIISWDGMEVLRVFHELGVKVAEQ